MVRCATSYRRATCTGICSWRHYAAAYPEARLFAAPGLASKRKDLRFDGALSDASDPAWVGDLDQVPFHGHRQLN